MAELAESLQPIVTKVTELATKFLDWFNSLNDGGKATIVVMLALVAAISPIAGVISGVSSVLPKAIELFSKLNLQTGFVVAGIGTFVALAAQVISAWSDMSAIERAASVIGLLLVAVSTLAVALGALTGIGGALVAAAGLVTGICFGYKCGKLSTKESESHNGKRIQCLSSVC